MLSNRNFSVNFPCYSMGISHFFSLFTSFPCYLMGISRFFIVLSIFHIIQWEFKFLSFFINFPYYSMGILHSLGLRAWGGDIRTDLRTDVRMDGRMDGRLEIHPCVLQDIGPLGPLPKKYPKRSFLHFSTRSPLRTDGWTNGPTDGQSLL